MKKLLIAILILATPFNLYAACGGSSPNLVAASHSYADVAACIADSTYDDTITVPAGDGSETWASTLVISKGVHLSGPGSGSLTISTHASLGISLTPDATSVTNGHVFEISGFTFDGSSSDDVAISLGTVGQTGYPVVNFHDNIIQNYASASGYGTVWYQGPWKGVIHSNTWSGNDRHIMRYWGDNEPQWNWEDEYTYGTDENLFFEDNTINLDTYTLSGGHSARVVVRFNQFNTMQSHFSPLWDVHGNQASYVCSMMGAEFYYNDIDANGTTEEFDIRGGRILHFGNALINGTYYPNVYNENCNDSAETCRRDGDTQTFNLQNSYHFLNTDDGSVKKTTIWTYNNTCPAEMIENAQFWNTNTSFVPGTSTTLSTGIGIGTAAQMAIIDTCTEGVGFWVTDEGTWNSDQVGADGRLYTCNGSNTFVLYYTPYAYPHPLRVADTTSPIITDTTPANYPCVSDPRNADITWTTDEQANCRIGATDEGDYDLMPADSVTSTDSTSHTDTESLACDQTVTRYVYCEDGSGNEAGETTITFDILAEANPPGNPTATCTGTGGQGGAN